MPTVNSVVRWMNAQFIPTAMQGIVVEQDLNTPSECFQLLPFRRTTSVSFLARASQEADQILEGISARRDARRRNWLVAITIDARPRWAIDGMDDDVGDRLRQARVAAGELILWPEYGDSTGRVSSPIFGRFLRSVTVHGTPSAAQNEMVYAKFLALLGILEPRFTGDSLTYGPLSFDAFSEYSRFWRERLEALRGYRGDISCGEASEISADAIVRAASIGRITEWVLGLWAERLRVMIVPMFDGGLQAEWTRQAGDVEHLEIRIGPRESDSLGVLATTEAPNGMIVKVWCESDAATITEAPGASPTSQGVFSSRSGRRCQMNIIRCRLTALRWLRASIFGGR